jgi:hypothetical protein
MPSLCVFTLSHAVKLCRSLLVGGRFDTLKSYESANGSARRKSK